MTTDIFDFWAQIAPTAHVHPADVAVLARAKHAFDLKALPGCFMGPLRSAPVVLLFLSPGLSEQDEATPALVEWHRRNRLGTSLVSKETHLSAYRWWTRHEEFWRSGGIGEHDAFSILGRIIPRRSQNHGLLAALPSSRVSLDWAQNVLFPEAEAGKRVVVCLRSAKYGVGERQEIRWHSVAPNVTRGGHIAGQQRKIIEAAQAAFHRAQSEPAKLRTRAD